MWLESVEGTWRHFVRVRADSASRTWNRPGRRPRPRAPKRVRDCRLRHPFVLQLTQPNSPRPQWVDSGRMQVPPTRHVPMGGFSGGPLPRGAPLLACRISVVRIPLGRAPPHRLCRAPAYTRASVRDPPSPASPKTTGAALCIGRPPVCSSETAPLLYRLLNGGLAKPAGVAAVCACRMVAARVPAGPVERPRAGEQPPRHGPLQAGEAEASTIGAPPT